MRILVVYYSWQRHTEKVARALAERIEGELQEIEPVSESGMFGKAMRAALGMRAPIRPARTDLSDLDFLVVASPVWAQRVPPYINEYLSRLENCSGKPFSVLVEMRGSGADRAVAAVKKSLLKKGMRFVSQTATLEEEVEKGTFGEKIEEFARTIRAE
ncbi:MAG: NAD(P)H-dependent oxidoreductase [Methanomicrobiaceae archaeon]|nr:NAD(P)H-dependent oxidoreductase [Methanomicrobiaceae archaeon]